jgi:hypothetical protein
MSMQYIKVKSLQTVRNSWEQSRKTLSEEDAPDKANENLSCFDCKELCIEILNEYSFGECFFYCSVIKYF